MPGAADVRNALPADAVEDLFLNRILSGVEQQRVDDLDAAPSRRLPPLLRTPAEVRSRQDLLRDLEAPQVRAAVDAFLDRMRNARAAARNARRTEHPLPGRLWRVEAAARSTRAVLTLRRALAAAGPESARLRMVCEYLDRLARSTAFADLAEDVATLGRALQELVYLLDVRRDRIRVTRDTGAADYGAEVTATFARFAHGDPDDYWLGNVSTTGMNAVTAAVLDAVAELHPEIFRAVDAFVARHHEPTDATLAEFERDVAFPLEYLAFIEPLRAAGLPFCYPEVDAESGAIRVLDAFDLALAAQLAGTQEHVVCNDLELSPAERIVVVTGPNKGGKTTYARAIGQLHVLAALGLPVPGRCARLPLIDRVFTLFERGETGGDLTGKLADGLTRLRAVFDAATPRSLVVLNEVLTSTALRDAQALGGEVLDRLAGVGCLCVCVTFIDDLASRPSVASVACEVDPADPGRRTHRLHRGPPGGMAYAHALAARYGLTYADLRGRMDGARAADASGR